MSELNALGIQPDSSGAAVRIEWSPSAEPGLIVNSQETISNGVRTWVLSIHSIGTSDHAQFILSTTGIRGVYQVISIAKNNQPIVPSIDGFSTISLGRVPRVSNADAAYVEVLARMAAGVTSTSTTQSSSAVTDSESVMGWLNPSVLVNDADGVLVFLTEDNELILLFYSDKNLTGAYLAPDPSTLTTSTSPGDENANATAPSNPQQQAIKVCDKLFLIFTTGNNSQVTINACVAWLQYCAPRPPA